MRQVGWAARLKQKNFSAAWILTGQWPSETRINATVRDVLGLTRMGIIVRKDFGWRPEWKLSS